jgi:3-oxoacyl-[acyl-carrier-protein] synthase II
MNRVAVTGIGIVSPLGNTRESFFASLIEGKSGIRRLSSEFSDRLAMRLAGQVDLDAGSKRALSGHSALDRFSEFALIAADDAVSDAGLTLDKSEQQHVGVYMGTGMGGASSVEDGYLDLYVRNKNRLPPFTVLAVMNNAAAAQVGLAHSLRGPSLTFSCACASSAVAIGEAYRAIRHGYMSAALAGGTEALLTFGTLKAWESLRALAVENPSDPSTSCRPFSRDRTGLILGEGASVLVLEDMDKAQARGAMIYAEIIGYGTNNDGQHLTKPSAAGQAIAMTAALYDAGIRPEVVDYINAHATATIVGDKAETDAIKTAFGEYAYQIPVSSTKSMHGHLMGAAGAIEFATSLLALQHQVIPPTANLEQSDPDCDLDYVPIKGRKVAALRVVMSNSFAFGGTNAVLIARSVE